MFRIYISALLACSRSSILNSRGQLGHSCPWLRVGRSPCTHSEAILYLWWFRTGRKTYRSCSLLVRNILIFLGCCRPCSNINLHNLYFSTPILHRSCRSLFPQSCTRTRWTWVDLECIFWRWRHILFYKWNTVIGCLLTCNKSLKFTQKGWTLEFKGGNNFGVGKEYIRSSDV